MKKLFKFVGTVAAISAVVAGGVALYKKFFAPKKISVIWTTILTMNLRRKIWTANLIQKEDTSL